MQLDIRVPHESHLIPWEKTDWRYCIFMGGRGNARSGTASRYSLSRLVGEEYTRGAIMRAIRENIKSSCWSDLTDRITEQDAENVSGLSISDTEMSFGRNILRPFGFKASSGSLTARLKSLANFNFAWIEEMEEIEEEEFMKFDDSLRTTQGRIQIIGTLNPPHKDHWVIKRWFDLEEHPEAKGYFIPHLKEECKEDTIFIPGTYRENIQNLDGQTIKRYEGYKKTKPDYYWQVIEGLVPESVRGRIYHGWELVDELPKEAKLLRIGGDWGWYPDPAAVIALYYCNGYYYVYPVAYGNELEDSVLAGEIKTVPGYDKRTRSVFGADEPKSIEYMRKKGINAVRAITGPGSVDTRIKLTANKKIRVVKTNDSIHGNWLWDCYEIYHWAEDKEGNPKGEPDHQGSDPMDAVSYAIADLEELGAGSRVSVNKPVFNEYGHSVPKIGGAKVSVNKPTLTRL